MRQFLDRMDKPRVDDIRGIPPAIAIEQSNPVKTSRSTVGTMTEINDYLKLLWPRVAHAFCPSCGREIRPETAQSIAEQVLRDCVGKNILITFWVAVPSKTEPRKFFDFLQQQGYLRVWIDNKVVRVDDPNPKTKRLGARVQVVQDRIAITEENRTRLVEAIETALRFGKGQVNVIPVEAGVSPATSKTATDIAIALQFSPSRPVGTVPGAIWIFVRPRSAFSVLIIRSGHVRTAAASAERSRLI